jgi:hypothetical protein
VSTASVLSTIREGSNGAPPNAMFKLTISAPTAANIIIVSVTVRFRVFQFAEISAKKTHHPGTCETSFAQFCK